MSILPSVTHIAGVGKPRLILILWRPNGFIKASTVANPTVLESPIPHQLTTGMTIRIAGHSGSTPTINGDRVVTVVDKTHFSISVNVTVAGTGGTFEALTQIYESSTSTTYTSTGVTEGGGPTHTAIRAGMRISSYRTASSIDHPTYAKVISKDSGSIVVDGWTNGTPTNGAKFLIDGYIADLPRTQKDGLLETFEPDILVHSLYRGDQGSKIETKFRGWKYTASLDYSQFISADTLLDMRFHLSPKSLDRLVLIPHVDAPQYQYNVYFAEAVQLRKYGISAGYKGPKFTFAGNENLAGLPMIDGYGTGYATNYGTNL